MPTPACTGMRHRGEEARIRLMASKGSARRYVCVYETSGHSRVETDRVRVDAGDEAEMLIDRDQRLN